MKKLWVLLIPGMHIKRWLLLLLVGFIFLALGVAYVQVQLYRTVEVPEVFHYLTLQFLPRTVRALLLGLLGLTLVAISFVKLSERLFSPFISGEENVLDTVYRYYAPMALGPLDGNMRFPAERRSPTPNAWRNPGCKQPVLAVPSPEVPIMRLRVGCVLCRLEIIYISH